MGQRFPRIRPCGQWRQSNRLRLRRRLATDIRRWARDHARGRDRSRKSTALGLITADRTYTSFGEPETMTAKQGETEIYFERLTYNKVGWVTDLLHRTNGASTAQHFEYDLRGRLKEVWTDGALESSYRFKVGVGIALDTDNPGESGIYRTGGRAYGLNVGLGIGGGRCPREIEGIGGDIDSNAGAASPQVLYDSLGTNGVAGSVGPGIGFSGGITRTETYTVEEAFEPIGEFFDDLFAEMGGAIERELLRGLL
jgi:hypothetical protein